MTSGEMEAVKAYIDAAVELRVMRVLKSAEMPVTKAHAESIDLLYTEVSDLRALLKSIPAGEPGPPGERGADGAAGPVGPQGERGETGAQGEAGPKGDPGETGADGAVGPQGARGETGPPGPAGETGATGPQGPAGSDGEAGPPGERGATGERGEMGAQGPAGPAGPAGENGAPGPVGETGAQGDVGPAGPQGEKGTDGVNGKDGVGIADAVVKEGRLILKLTDGTQRDAGIVRGEPGERGEKGDTGPAGPQGRTVKGERGERGEPGKDGRDGREGKDGAATRDEILAMMKEMVRPVVKEVHDEDMATRPQLVYREVWRPGEQYALGNLVTWGGSLWHCNAAGTKAKPGDGGGNDWRLVVKKGRDGKDAVLR